LGDFDGRTAELAVTFRVVAELSVRAAIDAIAVEICGIIDKEEADTEDRRAIRHGRKTNAIADWNSESRHHDHRGLLTAIMRQDDGDFVPFCDQSLRQCFDYVGQATGLGKRQSF